MDDEYSRFPEFNVFRFLGPTETRKIHQLCLANAHRPTSAPQTGTAVRMGALDAKVFHMPCKHMEGTSSCVMSQISKLSDTDLAHVEALNRLYSVLRSQFEKRTEERRQRKQHRGPHKSPQPRKPSPDVTHQTSFDWIAFNHASRRRQEHLQGQETRRQKEVAGVASLKPAPTIGPSRTASTAGDQIRWSPAKFAAQHRRRISRQEASALANVSRSELDIEEIIRSMDVDTAAPSVPHPTACNPSVGKEPNNLVSSPMTSLLSQAGFPTTTITSPSPPHSHQGASPAHSPFKKKVILTDDAETDLTKGGPFGSGSGTTTGLSSPKNVAVTQRRIAREACAAEVLAKMLDPRRKSQNRPDLEDVKMSSILQDSFGPIPAPRNEDDDLDQADANVAKSGEAVVSPTTQRRRVRMNLPSSGLDSPTSLSPSHATTDDDASPFHSSSGATNSNCKRTPNAAFSWLPSAAPPSPRQIERQKWEAIHAQRDYAWRAELERELEVERIAGRVELLLHPIHTEFLSRVMSRRCTLFGSSKYGASGTYGSATVSPRSPSPLKRGMSRRRQSQASGTFQPPEAGDETDGVDLNTTGSDIGGAAGSQTAPGQGSGGGLRNPKSKRRDLLSVQHPSFVSVRSVEEEIPIDEAFRRRESAGLANQPVLDTVRHVQKAEENARAQILSGEYCSWLDLQNQWYKAFWDVHRGVSGRPSVCDTKPAPSLLRRRLMSRVSMCSETNTNNPGDAKAAKTSQDQGPPTQRTRRTSVAMPSARGGGDQRRVSLVGSSPPPRRMSSKNLTSARRRTSVSVAFSGFSFANSAVSFS